MNNVISSKDFHKSFASSKTERTSGTNKLAKNLVLALSVVASSIATERANASNLQPPEILHGENIFSQYTENEELREINSDNFKDILNGKVSGIFKNPLNDNEIIAIAFSDDPDANKRIMSDLQVKFGDNGNLNFSSFLDENSDFYLSSSEKNEQGVNSSRHIQDPFEMGFDVNYTVIDASNNFLSDDVLAKNPEYDEFEKYFIYIHESGHALEHQQMDLVDIVESLFDKDDLTRMENSSDISAAIKTAQYMNEKGKSPEEILDFLMEISKERMDNTSNIKITNSETSHLTSASLYVVMEMIQRNPEEVMSLSNNSIENISDKVSEMAMNNNFKTDVIDGVLNNNLMENAKENTIKLLENVKNMKENEPDKFNDFMVELENKIENAESKEDREKLQDIYDNINKALETDDLEMIVNDMIVKGYDIQEEVSIKDLDGQLQINKAKVLEYPDFADKALEDLKKDNLWDAAAVAEENGVDIDRVVDLANANNARGEEYERRNDNSNSFGM